MTLDEYITAYLGDLILWTDNSFLIAEILESYGVDSESDATDTKKLHALTKYFCWKQMMLYLSQSYDFSADGSSYKTSQMFDFAEKQYADCYISAFPYLPEGTIEVSTYRISGSSLYDCSEF